MGAFAIESQADTILGRIPGGLKLVATTIVAHTGTGALDITVKPLTRIIAFIAKFKAAVLIPGTTTFTAGTAANQVSINPSVDIDSAVIEIWSWGV